MSDDEINRMDVARHLLPPPGNEVAGQLIAEVRRLRLTDAERSAIRDAADRYASITPESVATAATLRGLLERHGPTGSEEGHTNLGIRENGIAHR